MLKYAFVTLVITGATFSSSHAHAQAGLDSLLDRVVMDYGLAAARAHNCGADLQELKGIILKSVAHVAPLTVPSLSKRMDDEFRSEHFRISLLDCDQRGLELFLSAFERSAKALMERIIVIMQRGG